MSKIQEVSKSITLVLVLALIGIAVLEGRIVFKIWPLLPAHEGMTTSIVWLLIGLRISNAALLCVALVWLLKAIGELSSQQDSFANCAQRFKKISVVVLSVGGLRTLEIPLLWSLPEQSTEPTLPGLLTSVPYGDLLIIPVAALLFLVSFVFAEAARLRSDNESFV